MIFKTNDFLWENVNHNIEHQIVGFDDSLMMVKVSFKKGTNGFLHQHYHSQTTYVADGAFELTLDKHKTVLSKGDTFFVPSHLKHVVVCIKDGLPVDVFSSKREDFLK